MKTLFPALMLLLTLSACTEPASAPAATGAETEAPPTEDMATKLRTLNIELPTLGVPQANYVHAVRTGNLIFLAGKGPTRADGSRVTGKLGADLTVEQGYEAARLVGIQQLAALKAELGDLNQVKRIVKVHGMVNAAPDFTDHSKVINGFSDLMVEVFGERGKHARAAIGMGSLPGGIAVEIEVVVEVY
ncbi:RidA family protein [Neolewinella persica]|uniref:RidA family protein n=1 Tax=Neolewinella persica TaxID=70998 RepID=UPI00037FFBB4|nr:RidA family protein [Neolewinella persica]